MRRYIYREREREGERDHYQERQIDRYKKWRQRLRERDR